MQTEGVKSVCHRHAAPLKEGAFASLHEGGVCECRRRELKASATGMPHPLKEGAWPPSMREVSANADGGSKNKGSS